MLDTSDTRREKLTRLRDWLHDKYQEDDMDSMWPSLKGSQTSIDLHQAHRPARGPRNNRRTFDRDRYSPEQDLYELLSQYYTRKTTKLSSTPQGAKLRVDNLHYDLTEDDLEVYHHTPSNLKSILNLDRISSPASVLSPPSV